MQALIQALANGVMTGALLAVPAIGFSAIFAVLRYPSFAIAGWVTLGAFAGWIANTKLGLPAYALLPVAFLVAGLIGGIVEDKGLGMLRPPAR